MDSLLNGSMKMNKIPVPPERDPNFIPGPHGMGVQPTLALDPATNTYAQVDPLGNVVNVIMWDGTSPFVPPDGHTLIQSTAADIGDSYDGQKFTKKGNQAGGKGQSNGNPPTTTTP